ncbi:MAG: hypothetical protein A4E71_01767 [Smithella sp. PtaU1.Bin162]|nr:MAG: hypothetical protein A4E71_01767 [Smithella sp. PtaU1.Bin162]
MIFLGIKEKLKNFVVFNLNDIRKIDADFDLRRLNEWQGKGYLKMIRRGYYAFSDLEINESVLFLMANKIYTPSYVSLEMAMSHYHLIPEAVYGITSVTTRKTNRFPAAYGEFIYRHIKPQLMFGYSLTGDRGQAFKIAEIEKAVLDYFYLNASIDTEDAFSGLRFNTEEFDRQADINKLRNYLKAFDNKRLTGRVNKFLEYIRND